MVDESMLSDFTDKERWAFIDGRYVCRLLYHGMDYVVLPGDIQTWHTTVETFFKQHAYTSELNLDWWYESVSIRHRGVTRGMIFKVDKWLYDKIFNK